jgi:hypothetical protein
MKQIFLAAFLALALPASAHLGESYLDSIAALGKPTTQLGNGSITWELPNGELITKGYINSICQMEFYLIWNVSDPERIVDLALHTQSDQPWVFIKTDSEGFHFYQSSDKAYLAFCSYWPTPLSLTVTTQSWVGVHPTPRLP